MNSVDFFTPISYGDLPKGWAETLLGAADSYFFLGGSYARVLVLDSEGTTILEEDSPLLLTALKVASYVTLVIPLLVLIVKALMRSLYSFHQEVVSKEKAPNETIPQREEELPPIDPQKVLEEGLVLPEVVVAKVQKLIEKIAQNKAGLHEMREHGPSQRQLIFSIPDVPALIFRIESRYSTIPCIRTHYANMIKAVEVCYTNRLTQLMIPHAKLLEIKLKDKTVDLIVTEQLQFNKKLQDEYYKHTSAETVRQMALFIAKTGLSHVSRSKLPMLENGKGSIGLISLGAMQSALQGFYGDETHYPGLIALLSTPEQIKAASAIAKEHNLLAPKSKRSPALNEQ